MIRRMIAALPSKGGKEFAHYSPTSLEAIPTTRNYVCLAGAYMACVERMDVLHGSELVCGSFS